MTLFYEWGPGVGERKQAHEFRDPDDDYLWAAGIWETNQELGPCHTMVTAARGGRANVMTLSWHTMMEFEPPLVGCIVSDRKHSFRALKATRECVINIPTVEIGDTGARHIPGTVSAIPLWRVPSDAR
jgi:hypothetical protein